MPFWVSLHPLSDTIHQFLALAMVAISMYNPQIPGFIWPIYLAHPQDPDFWLLALLGLFMIQLVAFSGILGTAGSLGLFMII